ncbi:hypothetical protein ATHL_01507 [Anaerolinea thermolimosa]|uniref:hypothetical protein n=1 Tax=Anaerolinea thermolimosa TaxID=229919 RepID=UPI00078109EF|nr:hypothetical protein [Anaerolinea thermolimosa]GAP06651.1 hypothetical protein ATHL_01507 [Anaerolinea thermolimosa]
MKSKIKPIGLAFLVLVIMNLPFYLAFRAGGEQYEFAGFLLNPLDGNSYLAKMQIGWSGAWKFDLLYSPLPGKGAYLFLFYIFLGKLARWLHLSLIIVFHAARVLASAFLMFTLWKFFEGCFPDRPGEVYRAYSLALVGGGLGWLSAIAGFGLTGDFWIAEAYPFLSMFVNPHFPLGLALILWVVYLSLRDRPGNFWLSAGLVALLGGVQPFGVVIAALPMMAAALIGFPRVKRDVLLRNSIILLPGAIVLGYQFITIHSDPLLDLWNRQNITLTPPVWDGFISFAPAILLAIAGAVWTWKAQPSMKVLTIWAVVGWVLIYLPFSLQRRFMTGYYLPVTGLAVAGMTVVAKKMSAFNRWGWPVIWFLSILTNLFILLSLFRPIASHDASLFLSRDEVSVLNWITHHTEQQAVVLASPEMGVFIPARTGRRVVYGHPFESVNADRARKEVEAFYSGRLSSEAMKAFVEANHVAIVLLGPRETSYGLIELPDEFTLVDSIGKIQIYQP